MDMEVSVAESIAEHALGFFGFSNRIIDNALEPNDRNLFYQLQDYDLLTTESEETTLWDGRSGEYTTGNSSLMQASMLEEDQRDEDEDHMGLYEDVP